MREDFQDYEEVILRPNDTLISTEWEHTAEALDDDNIVSTEVKGYTKAGVEDTNLVASSALVGNNVYVVLNYPANGEGWLPGRAREQGNLRLLERGAVKARIKETEHGATDYSL